MLTFGGLGIDRVPYENLTRFPDWQFISLDRNAPNLPNLLAISDRRFRPVDLMPFCHYVVSKPGYSTFSEACRLDLPVISVTREDFAESPVLLNGLQDHAYHKILEPAEFFSGNWDFLSQPLNPPRTDRKLPKDGNEAIAQAVVDYLMSQ